jgi:hypothetical protein
MKPTTIFRTPFLLLLLCIAHTAAAQSPKHPLDGLTAPEY